MAKTIKRVRSKWAPVPIIYEKNTGEIHTKPNAAQSVREILFKNTQGMAYDNYKTPFYEDQAQFSSQPMNVIQDMDLSEKLQFLRETQENAKALETKIQGYKTQQEERQKAAAEAEAKKQAAIQAASD